MPYAVILDFDDHSSSPIDRVWTSIHDSGLTANMTDAGIRPHLTLAVYDQLTCQPCENRLAQLAAQTRRISLRMSYFGFFTDPEPVLFVAPIPTRQLIRFHTDVLAALDIDGNDPRDIYKPGQWIPHCTLAIGFEKDKLKDVMDLTFSLELPLDISASSISVVEYQPLRDLFTYDLNAE